MKKILSTLMFFIAAHTISAQCVFSCYTYTPGSTTYSLFPTGTLASGFVDANNNQNIDDGMIYNIPIGFSFNYFCGTYTTVNICTNGFIQISGSPHSLYYVDNTQTFPNATAPNGIVALNMVDLDLNYGGSISYTTIGTAPNRQFVVTYSAIPVFSYHSSLTSGQIVLYEGSGYIECHSIAINTSSTNGSTATQGMENDLGTIGYNISGRSNSLWSASTDAYRFTPVTNYSPTPLSGTITGQGTVCPGTAVSYSINTSQTPTNFNWTLPGGWVGTSTTSAISSSAVASGVVSVSATYSCGTTNAITYSVTVLTPPTISMGTVSPNTMCSGNVATIVPLGGVNYTLEPGTVVDPTSFTVQPNVTTSYSVYGTGANGCDGAFPASTNIVVFKTPTVQINSGTVCLGSSFQFTPVGADFYSLSIQFNPMTPTAPGIYTVGVVGTSSDNCVSNATGTLVVNALPTLTATSSRTFMCVKETVTLTVKGADTYSWVSGPTASVVVVSPATTTAYAVVGTSTAGCTDSKTVNVVVSKCTGISGEEDVTALSIYPNPSGGLFHVSANETLNGAVLQVYDVQGKLLLQTRLTDEETTFSLAEQPRGLYLVKVGEKTIRIVKE